MSPNEMQPPEVPNTWLQMPTPQEVSTLCGEWRVNCTVSLRGWATAHVIHSPYTGSSYGARLLGERQQFWLTEEELLSGNWPALLYRALGGLENR